MMTWPFTWRTGMSIPFRVTLRRKPARSGAKSKASRRIPVGEVERGGERADDRLLLAGRDSKRQLVAQVGDPHRPLLASVSLTPRSGSGDIGVARGLGQQGARKQRQGQ